MILIFYYYSFIKFYLEWSYWLGKLLDFAVGRLTLKLILLGLSFYLSLYFFYLCVALLLLTLFFKVNPSTKESLCDFVSIFSYSLFISVLNTESFSSNPDTLEAFSSDIFTNLPQNVFFPVEAVYLLVSIPGLWVLRARLSYYSKRTFYLKVLIYFFKAYFYYSCLLLGFKIYPIVTLNKLLA